MIARLLVLSTALLVLPHLAALTPWTWCYKKKFSAHPLRVADEAFKKLDVPQFTQLIFSWNAQMPKLSEVRSSGFRFFVRVRYADTQQWSSWHRMAEWGNSGAVTYYGQHEDGLEYCYVRLELPKSRSADGFQIKVESMGGAPFGLIKMLAVSISNFSLFEHERAGAFAALPALHIKGVPAWSQRQLAHPQTPMICSPTSLCVLASYLTENTFDPVAFADGVFDKGLNIYGSWPCNTAYAFHAVDGAAFFHVQRLHGFGSLYEYLSKNIPVVVSVRGVLTGAPKSYPGGHLLTVIGVDPIRGTILCHDPAVWTVDEVFKEYRLEEFLVAWEGSHRLAYIGEPV